jgi:hypothetical protein
MKSISFFILLIYWSIIIFAPVLSKDIKIKQKQLDIVPKIKPNK